MIAVFTNTASVLVGSCIGILFRRKLKSNVIQVVISALGLVAMMIGVSSAIKTENLLCMIICMAIGTITGGWLKLNDRIENAGNALQKRFFRGRKQDGQFTEGFLSACIIFCIGSMTITGALEAGMNHNNSILFAKSALDFFTAIVLTASFGIGVPFSALFILLFEGGLTLLAKAAAPLMSTAMITEMSAVGGVILVGTAFNMLGISEKKIMSANMLPAIFLPMIYLPVVSWFAKLFS